MKIVTLSKAENIWQTPFNPELRMDFKDRSSDKADLLKAFPELEELVSLPSGTKIQVFLARYTYTEGAPCGNPATTAIIFGQVQPHLWQIPGYLLGLDLYLESPEGLNLQLQEVGREDQRENDEYSFELCNPKAIKNPNEYIKYIDALIQSLRRVKFGETFSADYDLAWESRKPVDRECLRDHPVKIVSVETNKVLYYNQKLEQQMEQLEKSLKDKREELGRLFKAITDYRDSSKKKQ